MDLTAGDLMRVLAVCCGTEPQGPEEAAFLAQREQRSFGPTLYSAWLNEGFAINPAMQYELDLQTARTQRYRELAAELAGRVPGMVPLKGLEIAGLYPAGSVRYMNDLDYMCDEPRLWRLVGGLLDDGWDLHTGTFSILGGRLHLLMCLRLPHEDPFSLPYGIEVSTYVALGNLAGVAPVIALPPRWQDPAVKNLLMLLFERFEQPYRARDVVDCALLLESLERHADLWHEIDRLGLWPEYTELASLLARVQLVTLPSHPRPRTLSLAGSRARRAAHQLAALRRPADAAARHLQQRLVFDRLSRPERALWTVAERRLPVGRALRAGLLCFGLPVPGGRPDVTVATLRERDGLTFVDTPAARFLLTAGDEVDQDAVDRLAMEPAPAGGAEGAATPGAGGAAGGRDGRLGPAGDPPADVDAPATAPGR